MSDSSPPSANAEHHEITELARSQADLQKRLCVRQFVTEEFGTNYQGLQKTSTVWRHEMICHNVILKMDLICPSNVHVHLFVFEFHLAKHLLHHVPYR